MRPPSPAEVLRAAATAVARAKAVPAIQACRIGVQIPLREVVLRDGRVLLIDERTGETIAPCANAAVARRTREFFS